MTGDPRAGRSPLELTAKRFDELTVRELHALLALRADVFVVEQDSVYLDPDAHDPEATHLAGRLHGPEGTRLASCARWYVEAGTDGPRVRLGRVATARGDRGRGVGRRTVEEALRRIAAQHPGLPVFVHAQAYLRRFYEGYGFAAVGEPFDEDGVPHVAMEREAG
jgi:ElaA protein